jgi:hypothetical protein
MLWVPERASVRTLVSSPSERLSIRNGRADRARMISNRLLMLFEAGRAISAVRLLSGLLRINNLTIVLDYKSNLQFCLNRTIVPDFKF